MKSGQIVLLLLLVRCVTVAQWEYDRHVYFVNGPRSHSYFHSAGSVAAPSTLELIAGKLPVDTVAWYSPPNALRITWTSLPGGTWDAVIRLNIWRNRDIIIEGDSLAFWCCARNTIPAGALPALSLEDSATQRTDPLPMGQLRPGLTGGSWIRFSVPLNRFSASGNIVDLHKIRGIHLVQTDTDGVMHSITIDDIRIDRAGTAQRGTLKPPSGLRGRGYARHIDLRWTRSRTDEVLYYKIYRSLDGLRYEPVGIQRGDLGRYADYVGDRTQPLHYAVSTVSPSYVESVRSQTVTLRTRSMTDDELLTMVQDASFRYYWESAHPVAGMSIENFPGDKNLVATGASGFGIMAVIAGTERGFITRELSAQRMRRIVRFLEKADRFHGAWPHFLDGRTGKVIPLFGEADDGGDLVETAFLVQGLLVARQYFSRDNPVEREIRTTITRLWESVEWDWYRQTPESDFLFWHWSPDFGWKINHPLIGWNETMIVYLLAIASPTHPVPATMYYSGWASQSERAAQYRSGWGRASEGDHYANGNSYSGIRLDVGVGSGGPLFFTHYSFMGFDPRGKRDRYTNYFRNNRNIALINHAYCVENPGDYKGYGDASWGLTASDDPWGYGAHEPNSWNDNGTITPTGALASFPYTPDESMKALKHFYFDLGNRMWDIYGFRDAINESQGWVADITMGLNQAPMSVMIENYRTGLIWNRFMSNPEIRRMVKSIGFVEEK